MTTDASGPSLSLWIGYARSGHEFDVEADIRALGIIANVPKDLVAKRRGKQRHPEPCDQVVMTNYVFVRCTDDDWYRLLDVKHLARRKMLVPVGQENRVQWFIENWQGEYERAAARVAAGERLSQYRPGDRLDILGGPFRDQLALFSEVVEADEGIPRIKAEVEMMGRMVPVDLDVLDVRKAQAL